MASDMVKWLMGFTLAVVAVICTCAVGSGCAANKYYVEACDTVARVDDNYSLLLEGLRLNGVWEDPEVAAVAIETGQWIVKAHDMCFKAEE